MKKKTQPKESKKFNSEAKTNPWGSNQYQLDPRQKLCWDYYIDPKSETFAIITQSGIKAGFTEGYSDEIGQSDWFRAKLWRLNATFTGEKKMKELLELDMLNGGDKVDVGIARIQADLAKFIASTQGKDEGYSTKQEIDHTSKGQSLIRPPEEIKAINEAKQIAAEAYDKARIKQLTKK